MEVIESNYNALENSFIGELHENSLFNLTLYDELLNGIIKIIENHDKLNDKDNVQITFQLFEIYSYTLKSFIWHHKKDDLFEIKNYEDMFDDNYIERLEFIIKCFLKKDYQSIMDYEDEIGELH